VPELPEVETTRRGIQPLVAGRTVTEVEIRNGRLRWPVSRMLPSRLRGLTLDRVDRRAKYLLLRFDAGTLILHLGMSGSLRVLPEPTAPGEHDHVDIRFSGGYCLRLRDPRRFGSLHWTSAPAERHWLLAALGPEPLSEAFHGGYLFARARRRSAPAKNFIMDGRVVAGVGNIYAAEALHLAGIHPDRAARRISRDRYEALAIGIKRVLQNAIDGGGTTLRDFTRADGEPGYFGRHLLVYDRAGQPCRCGAALIRKSLTGQRATYYCPRCQR
jgi:formamidopyrimidine-DNA glycosylase